MMKQVVKMAGIVAVAGIVGFSGNTQAQEAESEYMAGLWAKPISNPVYTDLAIQKREINLVYIYNTLPSHLDTAGGNIPFDGDLQAVALQAEIPLTPCLSFVADKSGGVFFRPDNAPFQDDDGWTDLAAGLKWSFYQSEMLTSALRGTIELSNGSDDVFQGNGEGHFSPALLLTHLGNSYVINGMVGGILPFDGSEESTMGYAGISGAYRVTQKLSGHLELNWFRVLDAGRGESDFNDLGQGTHNILEFEGGDLINLGANDSEKHPDFVSMAVGARYQLTERFNVGLAYEIPLSTKDRGLMDERVTVDLGMTF